MSAAIAALSMDAVEQANSGHPGMPMGMADVATVLFSRIMKFDASAPNWPDRDRFVLSAGHGSMLVYSLAYLLGYAGMDLAQLKNFRQLGSKTAGHPEVGHAPGVETTTGPLGQGIGNAVGMAIAEAHMSARYGDGIVDHYTYAIAGDGCLMEGISQESIALAGHLKLSKLIVLWDDNGITIDGAVSLSDSTDQLARFEASGWQVDRVDGHDMAAVEAAILKAQTTQRPSLIACKTIIGRGANKKAGSSAAHGAPLGAEEIAFARDSLDWPHEPFEVPADILESWREAGMRGAAKHEAWSARLETSDNAALFNAAWENDFDADLSAAIDAHIKALLAEPQKVATRKASQLALDVINQAVPTTIGGSADLTGSNNTKTGSLDILSADNPAGRYLYYGIREHGMAAAMNGMALHGGVTPYAGTFLVFTDYCRPAIRLSALMEQQVIYVMTHDSIGLGEDGPTHQPVEHLAALRAIPNLHVFRPADVIETAECWQAALSLKNAPSILALSRQGLEQVRLDATSENLCAKGGYVLSENVDAQVTLIATGSEIDIAMAAREQLADAGIRSRIVSMPCQELFVAQGRDYMSSVLGDRPRIIIEAGIRQGWDRFIYTDGCGKGDFVGMDSFGASAPAKDLFQHFGITPEAVVEKAKALLT
ncbi:transketolase [Parvularcula sp. IMCC14364]|uniref:transketolase n=1 Tax=Parvularcula sp. IMCC14364 TaxID=3067902 RepID=UPI0027410F79|nr:transketolase [Parvularcula sp. IMCC14364]